MMAGHGLMRQQGDTWHLVGVAAWRRGGGTVGQRPRLYEMTGLTSSWVQSVIQMDGQTGAQQVPRRRLG